MRTCAFATVAASSTVIPVNDYTFPLVALTRGRKVARLLEREYGSMSLEDLRTPFFCLSADLNAARAVEHREGTLWRALRASVAIPGMHPARLPRR